MPRQPRASGNGKGGPMPSHPEDFCQARGCVEIATCALLGPVDEATTFCEFHYNVVMERLVRAPWRPLELVLQS
jgi:hypothetical protein